MCIKTFNILLFSSIHTMVKHHKQHEGTFYYLQPSNQKVQISVFFTEAKTIFYKCTKPCILITA